MLDSNTVYQLHNSNLGDHWGSYCLMTVLGMRHRTRYKLGTWNPDAYTQRLQEISELFQEQEYRPELQEAQGEVKVDAWYNWAFPALAVDSEYRWNISNIQKTVCYQFDGISSAEDKNPSPLEALGIRLFFKQRDFRLVRLGSHLTLKEAVTYLSTCSLFVGCDSGFSHIAHSVGCPVYMYEGTLPFWHVHRLKQMDIFKNVAELEMRVEKWLEFLEV